MILVQILGGAFLAFALSRVVLRWRDHVLSSKELLFWLLVFGGSLTVLLVPRLASIVARFLGIGRGADAVVYGSIVLLLYLVFRIYVHLENIEYRLSAMVREIALAQSKEMSSESGVGVEQE